MPCLLPETILFYRPGSVEDFGQLQLEPGQEGSREDVPRGGGELGHEAEAVSDPAIDPGALPVRIERPVLLGAVAFVDFPLQSLVATAGLLREDLDHQVRRALDVLLGDDPQPLARDEEE